MDLNSFSRITLKIVEVVNRVYPNKSKIRDTVASPKLREMVRNGAHLAAEHRLVVGTLGEISLRLPGGKFLISLSGSWFPTLSDDDLVVVPIHNQRGNEHMQLARHVDWHRKLYFSTQARAILLCQPVITTLFTAKGLLPNIEFLLDASVEVGEIRLVDAQSFDFAQSFTSNKGLLFIRGYGILAWGEDPNSVIAVVEMIEHCCNLTLTSMLLDTVPFCHQLRT